MPRWSYSSRRALPPRAWTTWPTRAGLSKAAIYLYFADKTALFQGVVARRSAATSSRSRPCSRRTRAGSAAPPGILDFMAGRIDETPMASIAKLVIAKSRAFPEIGRFYLKEVIGRGLPMMERLIAAASPRRVPQGRSRDHRAIVVGAMLLGRPLADGVRADRRRETRCPRARPPPRRTDVARVAADMETQRAPSSLVVALAVAPSSILARAAWPARLRRRANAISAMSRARPA